MKNRRINLNHGPLCRQSWMFFATMSNVAQQIDAPRIWEDIGKYIEENINELVRALVVFRALFSGPWEYSEYLGPLLVSISAFDTSHSAFSILTKTSTYVVSVFSGLKYFAPFPIQNDISSTNMLIRFLATLFRDDAHASVFA